MTETQKLRDQLADEYRPQGLVNSWRINYCTGFDAGHSLANEAAQKEIEILREALEKERLRLAGCGVAEMQNTEASIKYRITPENPYYCASYSDVCRAVDREMSLRQDLASSNARAARYEKANAKMVKAGKELLRVENDEIDFQNMSFDEAKLWTHTLENLAEALAYDSEGEK